MADKIIKIRKSATATSQKAQKKGGEDKTSSFGQDVSAVLAEDLEKWENDEREAQKAKEGDEEDFHPQFIPRGVSSTSRPSATATSTTPNEKRQKVEETKMGSLNFQQLFADATGRSLDDFMDQEALVSADRGGKAQEKEAQEKEAQEKEAREEEPPLFVRGTIKAR
jgi:hypothetical protein